MIAIAGLTGIAGLVVTLLILAAICGIAYWAINQFGLPPPIRMVVVVVVAVVAILILLSLVSGNGSLHLN